jgi:drug/metabolite transporter (DMT)-like permease
VAPEAIALVLTSAFLHALWNARLKREPEIEVASVAMQAVTALIGVGGALLIAGPAFGSPTGLAWALVAGVTEAGYFATLTRALAGAPLGLAYAISRGGAVALIWPISVFLLGERVSLPIAAGGAAVVAGLLVVGWEGRVHRVGRGLAWAAGAAFFIAAFHLAYKQGLSDGSNPPAVFAVSLSLAFVIRLAMLGPSGRSALLRGFRARPLPWGAVGVVCAASFLLLLYALAEAGAGAVMTLRNTSVVFAQGLAWALGERPTPRQISGALLITGGAVLLGAAGR